MPALVALRGIELDTRPTARLDRAGPAAVLSGNGVNVTRISSSRRHGRRFVHLRIDIDDVRKLQRVEGVLVGDGPSLRQQGDQYRLSVSTSVPPGGRRDVGNVGWDGGEIVAFRLHLPARIRDPQRAVASRRARQHPRMGTVAGRSDEGCARSAWKRGWIRNRFSTRR